MAEFIVTIDGPAASGKSTVARILARKIGGVYLDTGAMYRAVAWAVLQAGINPKDHQALCELLDKTSIRLIPEHDGMAVFVNGLEVTSQIRSPELTGLVRFIADCGPVRGRLVQMQRAFADQVQRLVTEGRDQGTVAFPQARAKFYLIADARERARRRRDQLSAAGVDCPIGQVEQAIRQRDQADQEREVGPLQVAPDAVIVDTTTLTAEEVAELMASLIRQAFGIPEPPIAIPYDDEGPGG